MTRLLRSGRIAALLAVVLAGCAQGGLSVEPAASGAAQVAEEYRLGVADKVRVTVFGEEALTGDFLVGGNGRVSLPLIGETAAAGLTISEFQDEVSEALKQGYITHPRVSAEVLNYRPFYILGEVKNPGAYPFTNDLTVLNAVATAGGFTYRADMRRVSIKRGSGPADGAVPLTPSTRVEPGDTIRIRERLF
jgi:polysaccharide export outer membrane protein